MSSCKDCVHYEVCMDYTDLSKSELAQNFLETHLICDHFKPKSRFVELPCEVGQTVYYISFGKIYKGKCHAITIHKESVQVHLYDFDGDNASYSSKDVYTSKEEAEKALKEREKE